MTTLTLTIEYPSDLLLSLKEHQADFEQEARLLLAVKLYELGRISTGTAAQIAGVSRVNFLFALQQFSISPIATTPDELAQDIANA